MEWNEIVAELEKFKDTEDYNNYIGGLVTPDRVGKFLETDDGKKYLQPTLDKYHSKGLESWKASSLPKLLDEEVKKRYPEKSPQEIELADIKAQLESIKLAKSREETKNKTINILNEKQLPISFVDFIIGSDEDTTNTNIEKISEVFNTHINSVVEQRMKGGYTPPAGGSDKIDISKMDMNQYAEHWKKQNEQQN